MRLLVNLFLFILIFSCSGGKEPLKGDSEWQRQMNSSFKDATTSPLTDADRKRFKGLDFFATDSTYVVKAKLERMPDSPYFDMKTTTERISKERIFGKLSFRLKGKTMSLNVYQAEEHISDPEMSDYLFLPFLDETNGESTYGGGRYIDMRIPKGDTMVIDFNHAYNPLCVYNEKYSCPLVPRENFLPLKIEAGMKHYKKSK